MNGAAGFRFVRPSFIVSRQRARAFVTPAYSRQGAPAARRPYRRRPGGGACQARAGGPRDGRLAAGGTSRRCGAWWWGQPRTALQGSASSFIVHRFRPARKGVRNAGFQPAGSAGGSPAVSPPARRRRLSGAGRRPARRPAGSRRYKSAMRRMVVGTTAHGAAGFRVHPSSFIVSAIGVRTAGFQPAGSAGGSPAVSPPARRRRVSGAGRRPARRPAGSRRYICRLEAGVTRRPGRFGGVRRRSV
jgi:hypothetical protein